MKQLQCRIGNTELLESYGYEPCELGTISSRWKALSVNWTPARSPELGYLRQVMLQAHLECCPDDERWIK